ncbi:MAG: uncharacterized protein QOG53_2227 [Frankiales bacterium]|jgi:uncharacterized protein YggE|nr:uncharacterized protein [Frankiales bacterium]
MTITVPTRAAVFISAAAAALALGGAYIAGDARASGPSTLASDSSAADSQNKGVTVSGLGRVTGTPDVLNIRLGVDLRRPDVGTALRAANATLAHVRDAFHANGVASNDMQTSGLSIQPAYTNKGKVDGYQVTESLNAKLRDLGRAGKTISAATAAGGNSVRIDSVYFDLENDTALVKSARTAAFAEAKAKAKQYADAAGRELGAVTSVSEVVAQPPSLLQDRFMAFPQTAGTAGSSVPIEPGTQDVTVTVTVVWSLR